ncbi:tripartite tricarboxylate transporter TctB family protein [Metabacillus herbersteinensis]|uniref:Tripartite tricarboxylate transporter TctB family protein n=1 Tax=Metabacillus herbersteinensis TaxID=283816 RepID=A0ABV6GJJ4_9BACI
MRNAGVWAAVIIMLFSGLVFWQSNKLDYSGPLGFGPGFLPFWLSLVLMILSIIYLLMALKDSIPINEILPKGQALREFLVIIGSMVLFVFLVEFTGFVIAGTLSLIMLLYRKFKWYYSLTISIGITTIIFLIFAKALAIPLPVNSLGW